MPPSRRRCPVRSTSAACRARSSTQPSLDWLPLPQRAGVPVPKPVLGNCNGYNVQPGDTLFSVAAMFQVGMGAGGRTSGAAGGWCLSAQQGPAMLQASGGWVSASCLTLPLARAEKHAWVRLSITGLPPACCPADHH